MKQRWKLWTVGLALLTALSGCGTDTVVPVVQVKLLTQAGQASDRYAGVVISENAAQVQRDQDQTIEELYVAEGDEVHQGQRLFRYDSDELNLQLDKQELELERLEADIKSKNNQVTEVNKELKTATGDTKTQLNIQLRQLQTELTEAGYQRDDLKSDIKYTKQMLKNLDVTSPIDGVIRKIDESSDTYILIQQAGAYQVQGRLNELNVNGGLGLGSQVEIVSRVDERLVWTGQVTMIDYGNTSYNDYDTAYGYADSLSSSSSYPFYVTLDSTDGLLLGQHVYIRLAGVNEGGSGRILVPESYLTDISYDEQTLIRSGTLFCASEEGKLERREVVLGEYLSDKGCYVILDGVSLEEYVADPDHPGCKAGAKTDLRSSGDFVSEQTEATGTPESSVPAQSTPEEGSTGEETT